MRGVSSDFLCLVLAAAVCAGCGNYAGGGSSGGGAGTSGSSSGSGSVAPPSGGPGPTDPAAGAAAFEQTAYPLLLQYCATCHAGAGPGSPNIAHPDRDTAYRAVVDNQKVNLANPSSSRLVRRLVADFHHCWADCVSDGMTMEAAISAWADAIASQGGGTQVEGDIASGALTLADGIEDEGQERYMDNVVAFWDFDEGSGNVAYDESGVEPAMDLTLDGPTFMSSYGIDIESGRAIATRESSRKLYDHIADVGTGSQQFSLEAWIANDNVTLEGPARIITYSRNTGSRNFTLGQVLYNYDFRARSLNPEISNNGAPSLQTYDNDQDLQATLQHVVITYDQFRGRRIYVNGRWTDDEDEFAASRLWNWDPDYFFLMGNENNTEERQWLGQVRLAAIYDHALTQAQIDQNFNAGVGRRLLMRFDVSAWAGLGSYVEFVVTELDDYSYLFCEPTLVTPNPNGFRVSNIRVSVNGQIPVSGQAFINLDALVTASRQRLSGQCSVVPKDLGAAGDVFHVEFEALAGYESPIPPVPPPAPPPDVYQAGLPGLGLRDYARLNETYAAITGVDPATPSVQTTYLEIQQQLPPEYDLRTFASSHQVGLSKLALEYCDQLVEDTGLRASFFPGFDFGATADVAFAAQAGRNLAIDPLIARGIGVGLIEQPTAAEAHAILDGLILDLIDGCTAASCPAERTRTVVKGVCAATLGSAGVSIH